MYLITATSYLGHFAKHYTLYLSVLDALVWYNQQTYSGMNQFLLASHIDLK